jgi:hypothetical protein
MPSNLNFNPLNIIAVSLKLTSLIPFKTNPFNAIKIYTNPFNNNKNWFDLLRFFKFRIKKNMELKGFSRSRFVWYLCAGDGRSVLGPNHLGPNRNEQDQVTGTNRSDRRKPFRLDLP